MRREGSVEDLSDGRRYRAGDLVRIGTDGCAGCSDCCRMDPVIVLDPYDAYQLQRGTGQTLEKLLDVTVCLQVIDGLIQPVLKMTDGICPYLRADGRCGIHECRPGICRLYPLGRSWEKGDFSYILQTGECTHPAGTKVKVKKWLDIADLPRYEDYQRSWHAFLEKARDLCGRTEGQSAVRRMVCVQILEKCYLSPFDMEKDFYQQFEEKLRSAAQAAGFAPAREGKEAGDG